MSTQQHQLSQINIYKCNKKLNKHGIKLLSILGFINLFHDNDSIMSYFLIVETSPL